MTFILIYVLNGWRNHHLMHFGTETEGVVKKISKISYRENEESVGSIEYYIVSVSFIVNGKPVDGMKELRTSEFEIDYKYLDEGDTIKIVYEPLRPRDFLILK